MHTGVTLPFYGKYKIKGISWYKSVFLKLLCLAILISMSRIKIDLFVYLYYYNCCSVVVMKLAATSFGLPQSLLVLLRSFSLILHLVFFWYIYLLRGWPLQEKSYKNHLLAEPPIIVGTVIMLGLSPSSVESLEGFSCEPCRSCVHQLRCYPSVKFVAEEGDQTLT